MEGLTFSTWLYTRYEGTSPDKHMAIEEFLQIVEGVLSFDEDNWKEVQRRLDLSGFNITINQGFIDFNGTPLSVQKIIDKYETD